MTWNMKKKINKNNISKFGFVLCYKIIAEFLATIEFDSYGEEGTKDIEDYRFVLDEVSFSIGFAQSLDGNLQLSD